MTNCSASICTAEHQSNLRLVAHDETPQRLNPTVLALGSKAYAAASTGSLYAPSSNSFA